jgi:RNA polymerase sigma factor (sigma-70 family)
LRYIRGHKIVRRFLQETRDDADTVAEDISTEVWLRVLNNEDKFDANKGNVKDWLYTIAGRLVMDFGKKRYIREVDPDGRESWRGRAERIDYLVQRDRKTLGNDAGVDEDETDESDSPGFEPRDDCPTPEEWLSALEQDESVDVILRQIDAPSRAVLEYRLQGLTLSEIAEKTNTPLSAVKARVYRGKSKLIKTAQTAGRPVAKANNLRCGSIECRPEKWVFYAGK